MKTDVLTTYLDERLDSIEKNLQAYKEDNKPKRLKRMRVGIKKIRSVLRFLRKRYDQEYDLSRLKTVFYRAGTLREMQQHLRILKEAKASETLINDLEGQKNKHKASFASHVPHYLGYTAESREEITLPAQKLDKKTVKKYFKKRIKKAKQDIAQEDRSKAHKFRKRLKNVLYLYKALPKKLRKSIKLDAGYLDTLQDKAGDWHDTYEAAAYIADTTSSPEAAESQARLETKEKKQFEKLLGKVKPKRLAVGA
ncbi:MAG: CHAD domain-containing protein [Bacteroidetes bacterium]|nr:CHAD domain-containing protein [Bacteroidota bacterium]